jgi:hypothetical protein
MAAMRAFAVLALLAILALLPLSGLHLLAVRSEGGIGRVRPTPPRLQPLDSLPPAPPAPPLPPPPLEAAATTTDLDALHPAEPAFWARFSATRRTPPWLAQMRSELLGGHGHLPAIPRRLHQTWKDANPPRAQFSPRWSRSLREHNADWTYRLWTDADNRALVAERYGWLLPTYDGYSSPIQRADVARYALAHAHGGVYADLDTECFAPFAPVLAGASLVLSYKAGANFSRGACNSIFASAAGHPFWHVVRSPDEPAASPRTPRAARRSGRLRHRHSRHRRHDRPVLSACRTVLHFRLPFHFARCCMPLRLARAAVCTAAAPRAGVCLMSRAA